MRGAAKLFPRFYSKRRRTLSDAAALSGGMVFCELCSVSRSQLRLASH
jgi:hypothetical protein